MLTDTESRIPNYQYSIKTISISLKAIFTSSAGFRCLSSLWGIFQEASIWTEVPSHAIIRQWLMKLGLFKLQQTHTNGKWMLIVDSTIQMGSQKVLLVLGIRLDKLQKNYIPSFKDAEPLVMKIVESCPGEVIAEAILDAKKKVQDVYGIVSDAGAEMKKGMRLLSESKQNTIHVYDIVHLVSNLLKNDLEDDKEWQEFKQKCTSMIQVVKLSDFAHLAPPRQRSKARLMASTDILEWGHKFLNYTNSLHTQGIKIDSKLNWILNFYKQLDIWSQLLYLGKLAIELVHKEGYHRNIGLEWSKKTSIIVFKHSRTKAFSNMIKEVLQKEGNKNIKKEHCLGSSVIIESAFGKFKQLENHHASSGITSLVLALPAIFGETDNKELSNALNNISVYDLKDWQDENLGQTYLSKRKIALKGLSKGVDLESCDLFNYQIA